jgi:hypothetical protein
MFVLLNVQNAGGKIKQESLSYGTAHIDEETKLLDSIERMTASSNRKVGLRCGVMCGSQYQ